ncbi:MAG: endonuclease/exonuclease/phosphatase (EEP) superfamily protein YafD [Maribacter sp.]|jgi:endonuclease/exonuclease/phosphatase (EEP) superfamily protein YafD
MKNKVAAFFTFSGLIFFSLSFLSCYHWVLELLANFRVYFLFYFLIMIFISLLGVNRFSDGQKLIATENQAMSLMEVYKAKTARYWNKNKWLVILNTILVLFIFLSIRPYLKSNYALKIYKPIKIISANILSSNSNYNDVVNFIHEENPDVIFFMELTPAWTEGLKTLQNKYPYYHAVPRTDNFGIGIFSKYELKDLKVKEYESSRLPSYDVNIVTTEKTYHFIGVHPVPPIGHDYFTLRNQQLEEINTWAKAYPENLIIVGDMNCSAYSANFSRLTDGTTLKDTRKGFGLLGTWSAKSKLFSFAIDHCLVSENIAVIDRRNGDSNGSDHYPIIIKVK